MRTKYLAILGALTVLGLTSAFRVQAVQAATILDPTLIPKYVDPLVIPPVMPQTGTIKVKGGKGGVMGGKPIDYYEIAVRQFVQPILPAPLPATTVWSYGSVNHPGTFNYPAFTIEAKANRPVRVKWINDLKDPVTGAFLPHLLPVDQTLHWANPPGGVMGRDMQGHDPAPYAGPVPIITHVHGAHVGEESDGYPEAWYLPAASDIPAGYATVGSFYDQFAAQALAGFGEVWQPGSSTFQYPNDQRATTLWYHDHTLGMTRVNVYAGPAGFYLLRGGPSDLALGYRAPKANDNPNANLVYTEIPLAIQDRTFNTDGSLFFPDNRAYFEGLLPEQLQIPFIPDMACDGLMSDVSPIWNPEFFGNAMVVNGKTWPVLNVEARRYRFRMLNGCNSRFLYLQLAQDNTPLDGTIDDGDWTALPGAFWQIGSEGGFLPAPIQLDYLLVGLAERADVIVDFTAFAPGTVLYMVNIGPDEPFGGGVPGVDFPMANPATTGQVMKFVVGPATTLDATLPAAQLVLPAITPLPPETFTRQVSLNEEDSETVRVITDLNGNVVLDCVDPLAGPFGPKAAKLGTVMFDGMGMPMGMPMMWMDAVTENPAVGATEVWEIYNFTMDAHPIHIHQVMFEVVNREPFMGPNMGVVRPPELWESGFKDTVIAYPDEITRVRARFDLPGLYVWHCHIIDHEDNEMMRPYRVGP